MILAFWLSETYIFIYTECTLEWKESAEKKPIQLHQGKYQANEKQELSKLKWLTMYIS